MIDADLYKEFDERDRVFKIYCAWTRRLAKKCDCWNCFARFIVVVYLGYIAFMLF